MKLKFKKETKHTVVYEAPTGTDVIPVESVYVSKVWLSLQPREDVNVNRWPLEIELDVTVGTLKVVS